MPDIPNPEYADADFICSAWADEAATYSFTTLPPLTGYRVRKVRVAARAHRDPTPTVIKLVQRRG